MTRSSLNEDKIIYETFFKNTDLDHGTMSTASTIKGGGSRRGTYVELGAYDGKQKSNSMFYDKCLQWDGLLIEGQPGNYQKVLQNRPYAHKMSFAPCCKEEEEESSTNSNNQTVEFAKYPMPNSGLTGYAKQYDGRPTVHVPCGPLTPVLQDIFPNIDGQQQSWFNLTSPPTTTNGGGSRNSRSSSKNNKPTINFFSLDVEGSEHLVLETIDFQKVQIDVMMIEVQSVFCKNDDCVVRKQVRHRMVEVEGYTIYKYLVKNSDVYVHPNSPYQMK